MERFSRLLLELLLLLLLLNIKNGMNALFVFVQEPESIEPVTGKNASFHCKANARNRVITYFWKFNGSLIYEDNSNGFHAANGWLYVYNVNRAMHNGVYECIAFTKDLGAIKSKAAKLQSVYFIRTSDVAARYQLISSKAYLVKAPTYKAFPSPTFIWQYEKIKGSDIVLMNVSDKDNMFITSQGSLLVPYTVSVHETYFKVLVYHPTSQGRYADTAKMNFDAKIVGSGTCPNTTMKSFPTVKNKTVPEGSNVSFECLAVAERCEHPVSIKWTKRGKDLTETRRRLVLSEVSKKRDGGTYECHAELRGKGRKIVIPYVLNVIVKPKLVKAVNPKINLPADMTLHSAVYSNTRSFSWYKDGDVIQGESQLFEVLRNGSLKFKHPSPAFSGMYQMFFKNLAGVAVVSQAVNVSNNIAGCGEKIFDSKGIISYKRNTASQKDVTCTWFFQLLNTEYIQFNITKFNFKNPQLKEANLIFFQGSAGTGPPLPTYKSNMTTTPIFTAYARGPFITIILDTKALSRGELSITYGPTSRALVPKTTTPAPTTKLTTTTTTKTTTPKPVSSSNASSKALVTGKSTTLKSSAGKKTPTRKVTTGKISVTVTVPKKKPYKKGGSNVGVIIGGVIGAIVLVALILLIIYRNRFSGKFGLRRLQDQRSLQSNTDGQRPTYPDVVPKIRPSVPNMGHVGPGVSLVDENPCYEPAESYGTTTATGPIYDEIGANTGNTKTTGKNILPPTQLPPQPTKVPPRPPEPFHHELKPEPMYHQVGEGFKPAYESAKGLTGRTGLTLPPKHKKNPAPYDSIPMTEIKGTSLPANRNDTARLGGYREPASSQGPAYQSGNKMKDGRVGNRYEDTPTPATTLSSKRPDVDEILYAEPFDSIRRK